VAWVVFYPPAIIGNTRTRCPSVITSSSCARFPSTRTTKCLCRRPSSFRSCLTVFVSFNCSSVIFPVPLIEVTSVSEFKQPPTRFNSVSKDKNLSSSNLKFRPQYRKPQLVSSNNKDGESFLFSLSKDSKFSLGRFKRIVYIFLFNINV